MGDLKGRIRKIEEELTGEMIGSRPGGYPTRRR